MSNYTKLTPDQEKFMNQVDSTFSAWLKKQPNGLGNISERELYAALLIENPGLSRSAKSGGRVYQGAFQMDPRKYIPPTGVPFLDVGWQTETFLNQFSKKKADYGNKYTNINPALWSYLSWQQGPYGSEVILSSHSRGGGIWSGTQGKLAIDPKTGNYIKVSEDKDRPGYLRNMFKNMKPKTQTKFLDYVESQGYITPTTKKKILTRKITSAEAKKNFYEKMALDPKAGQDPALINFFVTQKMDRWNQALLDADKLLSRNSKITGQGFNVGSGIITNPGVVKP
tara:strand:- start:5245 stop:6093 length:849 start_codon:yes stop_codon:yes gene_type:complete